MTYTVQKISETKENPENALYRAWKEASAEARPQAAENLLPHLRRHASKVCWMVLHSYQPHLAEEIVQDAMMDLEKFKGESLFSTWFHIRAVYRARLDFRRFLARKEVPIDAGMLKMPSTASGEAGVLVNEVLNKLNTVERNLVRLKIEEGLSDADTATQLGLTRQAVQRIWTRLRKRLRVMYGGKASK